MSSASRDRHHRHSRSTGSLHEGSSRHGRAKKSLPSYRQIVEALPGQEHLARSRLERISLREELDKVASAEEERHHHDLVFAPVPMVERKCPYGAPLPQNDSGLMLRRRADRAALIRSQNAAAAMEEEAKKKPKEKKWPGLLLLEIPNDPTLMPNEHEERKHWYANEIAKKESFIQQSRQEALMRLEQSVEVKPPSFNWDHLPEGVDTSEQQAEFFPRSAKIMKSIGTGKDPRFCRPMDKFYMHREAEFRIKNALKDFSKAT